MTAAEHSKLIVTAPGNDDMKPSHLVLIYLCKRLVLLVVVKLVVNVAISDWLPRHSSKMRHRETGTQLSSSVVTLAVHAQP